jgi:hypothetical protein
MLLDGVLLSQELLTGRVSGFRSWDSSILATGDTSEFGRGTQRAGELEGL